MAETSNHPFIKQVPQDPRDRRSTMIDIEKKTGWDCDYEGCPKTKDDGVLWRVNPKGIKGIFMCAEHARETNAFENRTERASDHE